MKKITLEELLSAGCHFGHQVNRSNPRANQFIFESRANVHIIDLEQTYKGLIAAGEFVKGLAERGGTLVIVGTKRQAKQVVENQTAKAREVTPDSIFYIASRWIGGTLTNFPEVSKNFKRLEELEELIKTDRSKEYTKRELSLFERELNKLKSYYEGIRNMKNVPDALFIIDTHFEKTAVNEAKRSGIKTVGIVDTNGDPTSVTHAIPANDDAVGSIELITSYIIDAWIEGAREAQKQEAPARQSPDGSSRMAGGRIKNQEEKKKAQEDKKEAKKNEKAKN